MGNSDSETTPFHEFERHAWDDNAAVYDKYVSQATRYFIQPLLSAVQLTAGDSLLDVATGPGYVAAAGSSLGAVATGIDFAENMVTEARRLHPETNFEQGDAGSMRFDDCTFDVVTINFGMLHFAEPDQVLREIHRVLRPGGRLSFTVWADPQGAAAIFGVLLKSIGEFGTLDVGLPAGPPIFRFSDHLESKRTLEQTGYDRIHVADIAHDLTFLNPDALFDIFYEGGARTGKLLRAQEPADLAAIKSAFNEQALLIAKDGAIPMGATLASARRPIGE